MHLFGSTISSPILSLSLSLSLGLSLKEINLKLEFCKYEEQSDTDTDTDTVTSWKFRLYSLVLNNCSYEGGRQQFTCLLLCTVKCFFFFLCRQYMAFFSKITIKRQTILLVFKLLKQFWYLSSWDGQHVHIGLAWKSSLLDSSSWSHPTNTFHTLLARWIYNWSKLDSISLNGNQLYWLDFHE